MSHLFTELYKVSVMTKADSKILTGENWGCKFQELSTGTVGNYIKPPNDLIIDDKAIRIEELGEITMGRDKAKPKREKKKPKKEKGKKRKGK